MPKPVVYAQLHEGFFIPNLKGGGGALKQTLPPDNKSLLNLKMTLEDNGSISLEWEEGIYKKSATIAAANVRVAVHAPELLKKDAPKK